MKYTVGSQNAKQSEFCWRGGEDGRTWPKGAALKPMDASRTSENPRGGDDEWCDLVASETRQQKLARLRAAIQCGEYHIPAEDVAERLLVALFGRSN